ncbi:MAG: hypothetical protein IPP72_18540 [Chitinophagaceae bacterium]|nr:hypothetical protein [Chitinophagaceae bacterium]
MKKLTVFAAFTFAAHLVYGQALPADKLLSSLRIPSVKLDDWAAKKKFFLSNSSRAGDTLVKLYDYKAEIKKKKPVDSVMRRMLSRENKDYFSLTYQTSSKEEFKALIDQLKQAGFYCNHEADPATTKLLFQQKDITVSTSTEIKDSTVLYSLQFHDQDFPDSKELHYADDLLYFTSHEYLVYYFGEENVKKDFYYFSGDELVNCSVLFINTARQVVFIWKDEVNKRGIDNLLFGGQQKLKSAMQSGKFVAESNWVFKSGVHAGMPLYELRVLNGDDLKFYAGGSPNTGVVVKQNTGKLDFKKEEVILGCVNCTDGKFVSAEIMNADEALAEGKILFVLSVVLNADADEKSKHKPAQPMVSK